MTTPIDLPATRIRRLETENQDLREQLRLSYGHDKTAVSFQESVLVDRFLPDQAAVTFRLGPAAGSHSSRVICQLVDSGKLELITLGNSVRIHKTESNRVLLVEEAGDPLEEFL